MYAGFILIGVLFGLMLTVTVVVFYVLSLEKGDFTTNLNAAARELRDRVTGRHRYRPVAGAERRTEDPRLRSLQEELRVVNRILEKEKAEKQALAEQSQKSSGADNELRSALDERDLCIASLNGQIKELTVLADELRTELADRHERASRLELEVRDLRTEIDVLHSGVDVVSS